MSQPTRSPAPSVNDTRPLPPTPTTRPNVKDDVVIKVAKGKRRHFESLDGETDSKERSQGGRLELPPVFVDISTKDGVAVRVRFSGNGTIESFKQQAAHQLHQLQQLLLAPGTDLEIFEATEKGSPVSHFPPGGVGFPLESIKKQPFVPSTLLRSDPNFSASLKIGSKVPHLFLDRSLTFSTTKLTTPLISHSEPDVRALFQHTNSSTSAPHATSSSSSSALATSSTSNISSSSTSSSEMLSVSSPMAGNTFQQSPVQMIQQILMCENNAVSRIRLIEFLKEEAVSFTYTPRWITSRNDILELQTCRSRFIDKAGGMPFPFSPMRWATITASQNTNASQKFPPFLICYASVILSDGQQHRFVFNDIAQSSKPPELIAKVWKSLPNTDGILPEDLMIKFTQYDEFLSVLVPFVQITRVRDMLKRSQPLHFTVIDKGVFDRKFGPKVSPVLEYTTSHPPDLFNFDPTAAFTPFGLSNQDYEGGPVILSSIELETHFQLQISNVENLFEVFPQFNNLFSSSSNFPVTSSSSFSSYTSQSLSTSSVSSSLSSSGSIPNSSLSMSSSSVATLNPSIYSSSGTTSPSSSFTNLPISSSAGNVNANINVNAPTFLFRVDVYLCHGIDAAHAQYHLGTTPQMKPVFDGEVLGLRSNIKISTLPRATKLCFILSVINSTSNLIKPLGWVNLPLYDWQGYIQTGEVQLPLWSTDDSVPFVNYVPSAMGPTSDSESYGGKIIGSLMTSNTNSPFYMISRVNGFRSVTQNYNRQTVINPPMILNVKFSHYGANRIVRFPSFFDLVPQKIETFKAKSPSITKIDEEKIFAEPLCYMREQERATVIKGVRRVAAFQSGIPKILESLNINDPFAYPEVLLLLCDPAIASSVSPEEALQLLDPQFPFLEVRYLAVQCLRRLSDLDLEPYLLQLVQSLKNELYHDSPLARFLLQRSMENRNRIGHAVFWMLKSELHDVFYSSRFSLYLEAYLHGSQDQLFMLVRESLLVRSLTDIATVVKAEKKDKRRKKILAKMLTELDFSSLGDVMLPIDPSISISGIVVSQCRVMDSATSPLWIVFKSSDPFAETSNAIFKIGDDLRTDVLVLQMLRIMDRMWIKEGMDLHLSIYACVATGYRAGMIQVVPNAKTVAQIQKDASGVIGAVKSSGLQKWIREQNFFEENHGIAVDNFIHSLAGYCVATYVLGIGDRHNDNIMISRGGHLFHIDFAKFLGNVEKFYGFRRERAPFVFTQEFANVIGKKTSKKFGHFVNISCKAFFVLCSNATLFITLMRLMLGVGIPELKSIEDIAYLRNVFEFESKVENGVQLHANPFVACSLVANEHLERSCFRKFSNLIEESLNTKTTTLNFLVHNIAHPT